ncbi:ubiquitin-conjugating enzyme E2 D3 isoform X2 [Strigops habroptila]|uniref:ubiquitin-conjugating enzyme E2 D3 isoform X2 n=1 Tax=Strigops habroptila TaxID=2489341 RepID=UPI0011CF722E|nr:ubiquitin-conjugating enzyme E2 D3 isoform X2 [Strigops habroptila]XP_030348025.1 ubiquitin-conjugating enzyme E2 D3 isoform X2 [Strigops habroptila]XP_030348026.1 ubiquitin-conjugating enzyme E2 D3 isoform X2 [Strigops habroptila]XP_030348027.1 ubiquitin-conjugating enzyme E2 D3 isoform X2 [Strigops habroptila]XP_030348028.1 ubiquitin-conjugating enzyme E2 D3 isoform X2 [Strigops habroptila]
MRARLSSTMAAAAAGSKGNHAAAAAALLRDTPVEHAPRGGATAVAAPHAHGGTAGSPQIGPRFRRAPPWGASRAGGSGGSGGGARWAAGPGRGRERWEPSWRLREPGVLLPGPHVKVQLGRHSLSSGLQVNYSTACFQT